MKALMTLPHFGMVHPTKRTFIEKMIQDTDAPKPLFENNHAAVILNLDPWRKGHALVVPKQAKPFYADLTPDELLAMGQLTQQYQAFWQGLPPNRGKPFHYVIQVQDGPWAAQTVPYVHQHVVPVDQSHPLPRGSMRRLLSTTPILRKGAGFTPAFIRQQLGKVYQWVDQHLSELRDFAAQRQLSTRYKPVQPDKTAAKLISI
jgi:diadenosine tetraphosphate (Ap4A) HIT family hydrolase